MKRAALLSLLIAFSGLAGEVAAQTAAQSFPAKPLRLVVGFPAGGPVDIVARLLAAKLSEVFAQQVLVDNRGGANGMIATEFVAKSAPDGYTMMLISTGVAINPSLYPKMAYDTLRDLQPVTLVDLSATTGTYATGLAESFSSSLSPDIDMMAAAQRYPVAVEHLADVVRVSAFDVE